MDKGKFAKIITVKKRSSFMMKLVKKIMTLALAPLFMLSAGLHEAAAVTAENPVAAGAVAAEKAPEEKTTNALAALSTELDNAAAQAQTAVVVEKPAEVVAPEPAAGTVAEVVVEKPAETAAPVTAAPVTAENTQG